MLRFLLCLLFLNLSVFGLNFDFVDARKKGYSDKEILDYVSKNLNGYDVAAVRSSGLSDKEIVDFFIQRDSVNSQLLELKKNTFKDIEPSKIRVYPEEVSSRLALGCMIYIGKVKQQNDGWSYISKLTDFAIATYTTAYLTQASYFDIQKAQSVSLKDICATWLDKLKTKEEINKLYALSLVKEINNLVKQKKSLILD
ncbi:hypothetical protein [Helicobacter sp. MIT 14-3879]|uniref:hypothetical protein n=1 Tax=Helicobacter sp. MIT 14-3879 TaxID=2040649 RepID=UPI000E1F55C3|nr:hypothetical protein [Helicobacter sp. MIT 14-3879]RDU62897.1 hypothetical protein CQA44_06270 [Helicobacter sp. MIT 14-3879]